MKYELTNESLTLNGQTLYRIRSLKNFGDVKKGDIGGFIASKRNLSQNGNAWVYDNAQVYEDANVSENAWVGGNAMIFGNAWVFGDAKFSGNA